MAMRAAFDRFTQLCTGNDSIKVSQPSFSKVGVDEVKVCV